MSVSGSNKSKELIKEVDDMVNTMKAAFKENLPRLEWISKESLSAAESKLEQMVDLIGYPEFVLNSSWVDSIYSGLSITEGRFIECVHLRNDLFHNIIFILTITISTFHIAIQIPI